MIQNPKVVTIERFILDQQQAFPDASGTLTHLLQDIALAGKLIANHTTRAGLADILGETGDINVQGEYVKKLDIYSHNTLFNLTANTGRLAAMVSEEDEGILQVPEEYNEGKYILLVDPLDGSSNIDLNVSVGTIFAIYRRKSESGPVTMDDVLQKGTEIVAAGYIVYASSTMMIYASGEGVHGFTLDPAIGEFLLSHPNLRIPDTGKYYSANMGNFTKWSEGTREFTRWIQGEKGDGPVLSMRYIGSMVADIHRTLLTGGIFYYPSDGSAKKGKLRLLYEAIPVAYIMQQAGGYSSNGHENILDLQPEQIHERTPIFTGNKDLVRKAEEFIRQLDQ